MRTETEIQKYINEVVSDYKATEIKWGESPRIKEAVQAGLYGKLLSLFWVAGHSREDAIGRSLAATGQLIELREHLNWKRLRKS